MSQLKAGEQIRISCKVNGRALSGVAEARTLLSDFLRHGLHLYGTHVGCEHGVCGACTVLIDGRLARSCLVYAPQADGADIVTVEGLRQDDLKAAFSQHGALQCGFCTAGILVSAATFLAEMPNPDEADVRAMLSGHLCRCTGYKGMVDAILSVARQRQEENA
jgi:2-furoyl-CoA dehydrogenase 2Fe-2S iron sulfur subunit